MNSLDIHAYIGYEYVCFCFPKSIQIQTKDQTSADRGCRARRQLREIGGYSNLILSKQVIKPPNGTEMGHGENTFSYRFWVLWGG